MHWLVKKVKNWTFEKHIDNIEWEISNGRSQVGQNKDFVAWIIFIKINKNLPFEFTHDSIVSISSQVAQLPPLRKPLIIIAQAPLQISIGYFSQSSPNNVLTVGNIT